MKKQLNEQFKRMQLLAGLITESQLSETIDTVDFGPEWNKITSEIFGSTLKIYDKDLTYRPSTDTGKKPVLHVKWTGRADYDDNGTKKYKMLGISTTINPLNNQENGAIDVTINGSDKDALKKEVEEKLIPIWKKASHDYLAKAIKNADLMKDATVGGGYKYEEKDAADLENYVKLIPGLKTTGISESTDIEKSVNEALRKYRRNK